MYAECVVRTGGDWDNWAGGTDATDPTVIASRKQGAIYWINQLRERAGNTDVWANNFDNNDALLQFILDERAASCIMRATAALTWFASASSLRASTYGSGRVAATMVRL